MDYRTLSNGDVPTVRRLLEEGADPNARLSNKTALSVVADNSETEGALEIARLLLQHGADVNLSVVKWTPIHWAAHHLTQVRKNTPEAARAKEMVRLLVDSGADLTVKSGMGLTARQHAGPEVFDDIVDRPKRARALAEISVKKRLPHDITRSVLGPMLGLKPKRYDPQPGRGRTRKTRRRQTRRRK